MSSQDIGDHFVNSTNNRRQKSDVKLEAYPYVPESERYNDPAGYMNSIEQRVRERMIAEEKVKILREALAECYNREGVNHFQDCKVLAQKYLKVIKMPAYGALVPEGVERN